MGNTDTTSKPGSSEKAESPSVGGSVYFLGEPCVLLCSSVRHGQSSKLGVRLREGRMSIGEQRQRHLSRHRGHTKVMGAKADVRMLTDLLRILSGVS